MKREPEPTFSITQTANATGVSADKLRRDLKERWTRPPGAPATSFTLSEVVAVAAIASLQLRGEAARRMRVSLRNHDLSGDDYVLSITRNGLAVPFPVTDLRANVDQLAGGRVFDPRPLFRKLGVAVARAPSVAAEQPRLFAAPADGELPFV